MKKILFINPCLRYEVKRKYVPVGLACILTAAEKARIEFEFIDMDAHAISVDGLRNQLEEKTYDIYAFGCIVSSFRLVKEIASVIRETNPTAVIIAGNTVATSIPEILLRNTEVDIAVMGEGDITIVEVLRALMEEISLRGIQGISFLDDEVFIQTTPRPVIADIDTIGFPNWDLFDLELYNKDMLKLTVDESEHSIVYPLNAARGCPYNCTFCYHAFKGKAYRKYSEGLILEEFNRLYCKYKATFIQFWDELTFINIKSVERIVNQLERLPFRIGWEGVTRGDLFREKDINLVNRMSSTGCKSVSFSMENASPEILKAMNKKIQIDRVVEHSHMLLKGGITPLTSIIFGYPQETLETIKSTLDLCERCNTYPSVGFLQPLPGTSIYTWAVQENYIKDEIEYLMQAGDRQDFHINLTKIPTNEFIDAVMSGMNDLARKMGLKFDNPLKTGVYQKSKIHSFA